MKAGKKLSVLCIFILIVLIYGSTIQDDQSNQLISSKVKITIKSPDDIRLIRERGISAEHIRIIDGNTELILDNRDLDRLKESGLDFEIIIPDMVEYYITNVRIPDSEMPELQKEMNNQFDVKGFEFGSMGGYYTYSEVVRELDSMRYLYPDLITERISIGQSHGLEEGPNDIWMVKISDNADVDEDEPEILYNSLIHAREPQGMAVVMYYMYYLLENYGVDDFVTYLVDNREMYFVPVINPDGYIYNEQINPDGGGMWRKNARDNGDGSYGVDLARNFGYMWGYDNIGSSPDPSNIYYRGPSAFSEPETQTIRDLCINHEFKLEFTYHTYCNWYFYPWQYTFSFCPDSLIYRNLISMMSEYNQYRFAPPYDEDDYPANGNSIDWMYGEQTEKEKIIAILPEVGSDEDYFWPSQSRIYPLAEENIYPNLILALGPGVIDTNQTLYTINASVSGSFLQPGVDTLFVQAELINKGHLPVTVQAYVEDFNQNVVDTVQMVDDGDHHDQIALDGIYGGGKVLSLAEDYFQVDIFTQSDSGNVFIQNDIGIFTTVGPVAFYSLVITYGNPAPGENIKFDLVMQNNGSVTTASDLTLTITTADTNVQIVNVNKRAFPDLGPGERGENDNDFYMKILDSHPENSEVIVQIDIASEGTVYWKDSCVIPIGTANAVDNEILVPKQYALYQNYPNPFNPTTTISYDIPKTIEVTLAIYDITGRLVETLVNEHQNFGNYQVQWDASRYSSGVYFYRINTGDFQQVRKMLLVK